MKQQQEDIDDLESLITEEELDDFVETTPNGSRQSLYIGRGF